MPEYKVDEHECCDKGYQEICFVWALVILPVFFLLVFISDEQLSLLDGVSMWPAEFLKMLALWLSYFLLHHSLNVMHEGRGCVEEELGLNKEGDGSKDDIHMIWQSYLNDKVVEGKSHPDKRKEKIYSLPVALMNADFYTGNRRKRRVWPVAIAWMVVCAAIYYVQTPNIPSRGYFMYYVDLTLTFLTFWGVVFVFATVSEATMHCRRFIQQLIDKDTVWPFMSEISGKDVGIRRLQEVRREWHEIKLIGMLTDSVSRTVYYPIYVILLLLAAQSDYFDNFDMPASLMLIASLNVFIVLCFSISLRRKAIEARDVSLEKIRDIEEEIFLDDDHYDHKQKKRALGKLRLYEKKIQNIREGAFMPITEQPWLRALTLMTGGGSSLLLLQYLAG